MIFSKNTLQDSWSIKLERLGDSRGFFARTNCTKEFADHGVTAPFVQQNMSASPVKGTIRGFHHQLGEFAEAKLVRCTRGAVLDVIIDLRGNSSTYLKYEAFELTDSNYDMVYAPPGFTHGFQTLTDNVEVSYMVSAPYTPHSARGVRYDDPLIGVKWPLPLTLISERDSIWPYLDPKDPPIY